MTIVSYHYSAPHLAMTPHFTQKKGQNHWRCLKAIYIYIYPAKLSPHLQNVSAIPRTPQFLLIATSFSFLLLFLCILHLKSSFLKYHLDNSTISFISLPEFYFLNEVCFAPSVLYYYLYPAFVNLHSSSSFSLFLLFFVHSIYYFLAYFIVSYFVYFLSLHYNMARNYL